MSGPGLYSDWLKTWGSHMQHGRSLAAGMLAASFVFVLPLSASKAQEIKIPKVGIIVPGAPGVSDIALKQGFARVGYTEGQNLTMEFRFARGQPDRVSDLAAELVRLNVDVIIAVGGVSVQAAKQATSEIPIVFSAVVDPIALGFAQSLERPGKNVTGITSFDPQQAAKQFEMLKELNPKLSRIAILSDQAVPRTPDGWNAYEKGYESEARALGLAPHWIRMKGPSPDLQGAFAAMISERAEALLVLEMPVTLLNLKSIAETAIQNRLLAMVPPGWQTDALVSFGTSILSATPRVPDYVDKILKGAKPGELPIDVITHRELVLSLKTAQQIGVTIPPYLLKRADRIIE